MDSSRASATGGAGLGLAIAKEIIERVKETILASERDLYKEESSDILSKMSIYKLKQLKTGFRFPISSRVLPIAGPFKASGAIAYKKTGFGNTAIRTWS